MKLVIAIVNNDDARVLVPKLTESGYSATTLNTTGGFLRVGNTTLLIGTEESEIEKIKEIFVKYCNRRSAVKSTTESLGKNLRDDYVTESVTVGGATFFVLDVNDSFKF